jgi:hypothetical protein
MRNVWTLLCLSASLLSGAAALRSNEEAGLKAVIDKAIQAAGGADKLAKFNKLEMKGKGTFYGLGMPVPYTGEWALDRPSKMHVTIASELGGKTYKFTKVINDDKGWKQLPEQQPEKMSKDEVQEGREEMYAGWVATLLPLREKGFTLSPLGKMKVGQHETDGIRVSHKDHRDVSLFFDRKSGLLVKSQTRIKDVDSGGKEQTQDTLFQDYKMIDGAKLPTRVTIKRDDKLYVEGEMTEFQPRETFPEATFNRP